MRDDAGENQGCGNGSEPDIDSDGETTWRWREGQAGAKQKARSALPEVPSSPSGALKQCGKPMRKRSRFAGWEERDFD